MSHTPLKTRLKGPIAQALKQELGVKNTLALPRIEKVIVSCGINRGRLEGKEMQAFIVEMMTRITGQKPVVTKARKAISNFKIRENMVVGAMVTLRGDRMLNFLDRLISYILPRIRDFRGLPIKLDGHGNYSIGLRDQTIFPEVPPVDAKQMFGLQIQIKTTTNNDAHAFALLKQMHIPFRRDLLQKKSA